MYFPSKTFFIDYLMKQRSNESVSLSVLISFKPNKLLASRNPVYPGKDREKDGGPRLSVTQRSSPISCLWVSGGPFTSLPSDKGCCLVAPTAPTADLLLGVPLLTKWRQPLMTRFDGAERHMVCVLHLSPPRLTLWFTCGCCCPSGSLHLPPHRWLAGYSSETALNCSLCLYFVWWKNIILQQM